MDSLQSLYEKLGQQIELVENTLKRTDVVSTKLNTLSLSLDKMPLGKMPLDKMPLDKISLDNVNTENCSNSSFRKINFRFKPNPTIKHQILSENKNKTISYSNLCQLLVSYILTNKLSVNGQIHCDGLLQEISGEKIVDFFTLIKNLAKIIV